LRIHGTNQPSTIGQAVSNGCARLVNDHVIEPYKKVPMGTKVYLYPRAGNPTARTSTGWTTTAEQDGNGPTPAEGATRGHGQPPAASSAAVTRA